MPPGSECSSAMHLLRNESDHFHYYGPKVAGANYFAAATSE
jgi:hypothetical protein